MKNIQIDSLFDLNRTIMKDYLQKHLYPWEILDGLKEEIKRLFSSLDKGEYVEAFPEVFISKHAVVAANAEIYGPAIICPDAEIRHCAFIRGSAVIGSNTVLGNSCEIKNSIMFDGSHAPHYSYIGDSILGWNSHFGAAAIASNLKSDKKNIIINGIETNRRKIGAMVGDNVEVGAGSILNPGTIIGKNTNIYPLSCVRGIVPENKIYKSQNNIVDKEIR